jgi:hypothetical protein
VKEIILDWNWIKQWAKIMGHLMASNILKPNLIMGYFLNRVL